VPRDEQPAAQAIDWPVRYSRSLLQRADDCLRSAYLHVRHDGGASNPAMERGGLAHEVFARMAMDLLDRGERRLWVGVDPSASAQEVADYAASVVDAAVRASQRHVPIADVDAVRQMAYHYALALDLEPDQVVAVERKFVADVAGHEVSGIVDVALLDGDTLEVRDLKTSFAVPDQGTFERAFQLRCYAALMCFGFPVRDVDGVEVRDPSVGESVRWVRLREIYPRYLTDDGGLVERATAITRADAHQFLVDVGRLVERLDAEARSWRFPAVAGSHCTYCPSPSECPILAELRPESSELRGHDDAAMLAQWADVMRAQVADADKQVKAWAGANDGRVRYGKDRVREFSVSQSRAIRKRKGRADLEGLTEAATRAAEFGEPFDAQSFVETRTTNTFRSRTLSQAELDAEREEPPVEPVGARFGDDVPF